MGCGCAKRQPVGGRVGQTVGFVCVDDEGDDLLLRDGAPRVFADTESALLAAEVEGIPAAGVRAVIV